MEKKDKKTLLYSCLCVIGALTCGAFLDFYPFLGDDLVVREIQYCTFVICMTIVICAVQIRSKGK